MQVMQRLTVAPQTHVCTGAPALSVGVVASGAFAHWATMGTDVNLVSLTSLFFIFAGFDEHEHYFNGFGGWKFLPYEYIASLENKHQRVEQNV